MQFTSLSFFVLLLVTVALYWALPWQRARLVVLFAASLIFYSAHYWPSALLLLATVIVNFEAGRWQERKRNGWLLAAAISVDLSLLLWFKYAAFLSDNLLALVHAFGLAWSWTRPSSHLPLGISFFTFQVVAYQIDVYRREIPAEQSWLRFAVFKCFFPQLIAGPIVRAADFLPQLRRRIRLDAEEFHQGLFLIIAGLALKIGVADVLAQFAREAFKDPASLTTVGAWTGIYAFSFQLFADFWGYSTMAVGMAHLFGLTLPHNFDAPYLSTSLQEFWRRWHITLSNWFRDYLYIPLGGNRKRAYWNLLVTMTIAGLWHGAGWTFVLWGFVNGLWLVLERLAPRVRLPGALKTLLVFHGVALCWVLFRAPTMHIALAYYKRLLLPPYNLGSVPMILAVWLVLFALIHPALNRLLRERRFTLLPIYRQVALAGALLFLVVAYAGAQIDFIYFAF